MKLWGVFLALGPVSLFLYFNVPFIHSTLLTNNTVKVALTCILQICIYVSLAKMFYLAISVRIFEFLPALFSGGLVFCVLFSDCLTFVGRGLVKDQFKQYITLWIVELLQVFWVIRN